MLNLVYRFGRVRADQSNTSSYDIFRDKRISSLWHDLAAYKARDFSQEELNEIYKIR